MAGSPGWDAVSPDRNPRGPAAGQRRASRGGSWRHAVKVTRCAHRSAILPERQLTDYGFRVALEVADSGLTRHQRRPGL